MLFRMVFTFLAVMAVTFGGVVTGTAQAGGDGKGDRVQYTDRQGRGSDSGIEFCKFHTGYTGLSQVEIDSLLFMREEEKVARDSYLVLGELWGMVIFANISEAEQRHLDAMKALIDCYRLDDPVIDGVGLFTDPNLQQLFDDLVDKGQQSAMEGLYVGALIEETDIVDIQSSIDNSSHDRIISTYESLLCGSRNHLRAFVRQIENNGGSYAPTVMDPAAFWEIAYSSVEHDCGDY